MFDTSVIRTRPDRRRFSVLTVSLAIHSAIIVAAVSASIASVEFPVVAPDQAEIFTPVMTPSMPPLPKGQPIARTEPAAPRPAPAPAAQQVTAPQEIPHELPEATASLPAPAIASTGSGSVDGVVGQGPVGDPNGVEGAVDVGQPVSGSGPATGDMTYRPGGEVRPARVLRRVEPRYPQLMINARVAAVVTVSCIIGKDGRMREPSIIKSSHPPFNAAVIDALRQWTFAPGTMRGEPVDTWFELTVSFNVR